MILVTLAKVTTVTRRRMLGDSDRAFKTFRLGLLVSAVKEL